MEEVQTALLGWWTPNACIWPLLFMYSHWKQVTNEEHIIGMNNVHFKLKQGTHEDLGQPQQWEQISLSCDLHVRCTIHLLNWSKDVQMFRRNPGEWMIGPCIFISALGSPLSTSVWMHTETERSCFLFAGIKKSWSRYFVWTHKSNKHVFGRTRKGHCVNVTFNNWWLQLQNILKLVSRK